MLFSSGPPARRDLRCNRRLNRSCRVKSRSSSWWRPRWGYKRNILAPRPIPGRPGWRSWVPVAIRDRLRWFNHRFWSLLDFSGNSWLGWGGGGGGGGSGTKDGTGAGSWAASFGPPLTAPGAHGFFPFVLFLLLSPNISVTEPRLPLKATRNSASWPKVANIVPGWGGGGG